MEVVSLLSCCLTSTEARWPIRDGDRVGRGRESERLDRGNRPKKTGETVDRRQNNGSVKAVSPRHCPATCALRTAQLLFQLLCWTESLRQCPLHRCWRTTWTTRSKRRPTCSAQLHLPTHDLFWAMLRVQLHLPPLRSLDLLISPGTLSYGSGGRERLYTRLLASPHCHHQNDWRINLQRWEPLNEGQSHKTVSTDHNFWRLWYYFVSMKKRKESQRGVKPKPLRLPAKCLTTRPNRLTWNWKSSAGLD